MGEPAKPNSGTVTVHLSMTPTMLAFARADQKALCCVSLSAYVQHLITRRVQETGGRK